MRGLPLLEECEVVKNELVVLPDEAAGVSAVRRLRLALLASPNAALGVDGALGEVVKIRCAGGPFKVRSYCVVSPPGLVGAFEIVVRIYAERAGMSAALAKLQVGERVSVCVHGPLLWKVSKPLRPAALVGAVAFGVGITKVVPVLAAALASGAVHNAVLVWANRVERELAMLPELAALLAAHRDRLTVVHVLPKREQPGAETFAPNERVVGGRVGSALLEDVFSPWKARAGDAAFIAVGSKPSIKATWRMLKSLGFTRSLQGPKRLRLAQPRTTAKAAGSATGSAAGPAVGDPASPVAAPAASSKTCPAAGSAAASAELSRM
jgi:NAD(P)H-flavin reductase